MNKLFYLLIFFILQSCVYKKNQSVVLIEDKTQQADGSIKYGIYKLGVFEAPPASILTSIHPNFIVSCNKREFYYIDYMQGTLWSKSLLTNEASLLAKKLETLPDDVTGLTYLVRNPLAFYRVIHSMPERLISKGNSYKLRKYNSDGSYNDLLSGDGKAYALWESNNETLSLVTSSGVREYNTRKNQEVNAKQFPEKRNDFTYMSQRYAWFSSDNGKTINVKYNSNWKNISQIDFKSNFGIVVDFSEAQNSYLVVEVDTEHGDRLWDVDVDSGEKKLMFKGTTIGRACYL